MNNEQERSLLPCPFCGSNNLEDATVGAEYVSCLDCGAFGPSSGLDHSFQREIRLGEARNKWNDRPAHPEGWRLVPVELIDFLDDKEHHLPVEDRHVLSVMLAAPKFGEEE